MEDDMKINGNQIKIGNVLEHKGSLFVVTKTQAVKPGKGGAFNQVEMKSIIDNTKLNERFRSDEIVERVRIESESYQYLYSNDSELIFMNSNTYEQISANQSILDEKKLFLKEGMIVEIELYEGSPVSIILPETVTLKVKDTEPSIKGQTAASSSKPAILENDIRVTVPPFINNDDTIIVDTNELTYIKRAD
jgi:elongation factor P